VARRGSKREHLPAGHVFQVKDDTDLHDDGLAASVEVGTLQHHLRPIGSGDNPFRKSLGLPRYTLASVAAGHARMLVRLWECGPSSGTAPGLLIEVIARAEPGGRQRPTGSSPGLAALRTVSCRWTLSIRWLPPSRLALAEAGRRLTECPDGVGLQRLLFPQGLGRPGCRCRPERSRFPIGYAQWPTPSDVPRGLGRNPLASTMTFRSRAR
jgi:hypothetical protein